MLFLTCSSVSFIFCKFVVRSGSWVRLRFQFSASTLPRFPPEVYLTLHYWCKATNPPSFSPVLKLSREASLLIYITLNLYCPLPWSWHFLPGHERICLKLRVLVPRNTHSHCLFRIDDDITSSLKTDAVKSKGTVFPLTLRAWSPRGQEIL